MSQPPEYPGSDPQWGNQNPPGYPPPPGPPPGYGAPPPPPPPPGYGPPPGGYNPSGPPGPPPGRPPGPPPGPPPGYGPPPSPPPPQPPGPGYGAPPTSYPPQPGYGGQPGGPPGQPFSVGEAFSWAWNKFTQNAVALVVATLAYGVVLGIAYALSIVGGGLGGTTTTNTGYGTSYTVSTGPSAVGLAVMIVGYLLAFAVGIFAQAAFLSGILDIADGRQVGIGSFFKPRNFGTVILASLLVSVLTGLGSVACVLPGLVVGFFAMFTVPFAIDRSQGAIDALKSSFSTVSSNFGNSFLAYLVQVACVVAGSIVCGIGLLVGGPVGALILIYAYRKLSGGQVVPVQQPGYPAGPPPGLPPGYQQGGYPQG
jgi:uncharacterized membrane protein